MSFVFWYLIIIFIYPDLTWVALPLTLLPTIVVSWLFGLKGTFFIVPFNILVHLTLFYQNDDLEGMILPINLVAHFMIMVIAALTGKLSEVSYSSLTPNTSEYQKIENVEHQKTENALRESEESYRLLVELSPNAIIVHSEGKIVFTNLASIQLFGASGPEQLIGKNIIDLVHPDDRELVKKRIRKVRMEKTIPPFIDEKLIRLDGSGVDAQVTASALTYQSKPAIQVLIQDVTKRKQLEQKLRQTQKMEAIGVLTGGIAHEFNNLLTPILGYTEILLDSIPEKDPEREFIQQIQFAGNRAKRLVQQMLAYGRKSMSKKEAVQLEVIAEDTVKFIKNTIPPNILIKKEIEENLPPILGMPNEIHQIILNLCINASHSMPEGGELTIGLKKKEFRNVTNLDGQKREGVFICLDLQDTGSGMEQDTVDLIFDPFFTTKEVGQGSGLGLSVVQGIVDQHKGWIDVDSKIGEGTTFHVYFPATKKNPKAATVKSEHPLQGNGRILLVDDEPMIIHLVKSMLRKLGYEVTDFLDCTEALRYFTKYSQDFDLVVADYGMPKMNGKQLGKHLKEIRSDIPIILFTGYGDLVSKENIETWGMDDLLIKPFKFNELSETVKGVLKTKGSA